MSPNCGGIGVRHDSPRFRVMICNVWRQKIIKAPSNDKTLKDSQCSLKRRAVLRC